MPFKMIEITPNQGKYKHGFTVKGHAEYAEHGRDIVCASVSVLAQMFAHEIKGRRYGVYEERSGFLSVHIHIMDDYIENVLSMILNTLRTLQTQYPQYVKVGEEYGNH